MGALAWTALKTVENEEAVVARAAGRCADEAASFPRIHNQACINCGSPVHTTICFLVADVQEKCTRV